MFANSKLSAADFWRASAINMRSELTQWKSKDPPPTTQDSGPVSPAVFSEITEQAYGTAVKMMSLCSLRSEDDLREVYAMSKNDSRLRASRLNEDCEDPGADDDPERPETTPEDLLHHVRDSQALSTAMGPDGSGEPAIKCDDDRATLLHERSRGHRGDPKVAAATFEICNMEDAKPVSEPPRAEEPLHKQEKLQLEIQNLKKNTLAAVLRGCENFESAKHGSWMLLCYLRMQPQGCDSELVKSHFHTRASLQPKVAKWHDAVRHQIAVVEAQERMPATRTSRVQGWVQSCEQQRESQMPTLPSTLTIHTGQIVAVFARGTWSPAMILSVWRAYKKGSGAQLAWRELSRGAMHSVRVVLLRPGNTGREDVFLCDTKSECMVLALENVGLRLDTAKMREKKAIDGTKIQLDEDTDHQEGPQGLI